MRVVLYLVSGVAGSLAAQGGGQICRPFVLGFGNWRACLKYKSDVMSTVTLVLAVMLCFYCTQTHMKLQSKFSRDFFKTNFRPFAAPSKCRPVRPAPPHSPRYASVSCKVYVMYDCMILYDSWLKGVVLLTSNYYE